LPKRYLLYVGRLVKEKGVFDVLESYANLTETLRQEVALVFAGSGPESSQLADRSSRICPGTVRFLDFVHREDLAAIYGLADALVLPTHSDPWGLVVNEAMACGLPIVTTHVAGCALDLVQHGLNGHLVDPGDVSGLCLAMAKLAESALLRTEMGEASRQRIQEYSPDNWAQGIVKAIESVRSC
jgi:glycosyltransferase involved in cell wall biosynthesis